MTVPPPLPSPPAGTTPHLGHAFGGVWRLTWRRMLVPGRGVVATALLLALGLLTWLAVGGGDRHQFLEWASGFYLSALVPVAAFLSGAGIVREDTQPGTVDYVLTRPVPRSLYMLYRYAAQLALVQLAGLMALGVLLMVSALRDVPGVAELGPVLLLAQVLAIPAFLALGFVCGALTSRYLVLGLLYGAVIEIGLGQIPMQLSRLSILHHVRVLLQPYTVGLPEDGLDSAWALSLGTLVLIAAALAAAAAATFSLREFAGNQPKDA